MNAKKFYAVFLGEDQVSPVYDSYEAADAWAEEHYDLEDDRVSIDEVENPNDERN